MWTNQEVEFQPAKAGTTLYSVHEYRGIKSIKSISVSCKCVTHRLKNNQLSLEWKTKSPIPESYVSFKYVTISYQDGSVDEIQLKVKLLK